MDREMLISSVVTSDGTFMALTCVRKGLDWILGILVCRWKGHQPLQQAPKGSSYGTKPVGVQELFGQYSQICVA